MTGDQRSAAHRPSARQHLRIHGAVPSTASGVIRHEPSMSLCSLEVIRRYGGPVASMALEAMLRLAALDEVLVAVRSGTGLALRIWAGGRFRSVAERAGREQRFH